MSRATFRDKVRQQKPIDPGGYQLTEHVVAINRVTKVVKGGKNLSFSALVVVGDKKGVVGFGMGKAREVPMAIRKGIEVAKKNLLKVNLTPPTIPHQVIGRYSACRVLLKPAPEGAGVIAGGPIRPVMEAAGIHDVFTKALGNTNPHNVIKATLDGLLSLKDKKVVAQLRGKEPQEL
ncbi:MAG: 30S ribosomal protein S5 [Candidatus Acidiferrales bacterium]|nr:30S ribosomal protein S5 [Acidobacteriota bacterium]MCH8946387.1 30S ribosomal protein S5 [Acidobacteriota bacterium]